MTDRDGYVVFRDIGGSPYAVIRESGNGSGTVTRAFFIAADGNLEEVPFETIENDFPTGTSFVASQDQIEALADVMDALTPA